MDPVIIVTAIVTFAGSIRRVSLFIERLFQAPEFVLRLQRDLQQFEYELEILQRQLLDSHLANFLSNARVQELLFVAESDLNMLHLHLRAMTKERRHEVDISYWNWLLVEQKCERLHLKLTSIRDELIRLRDAAVVNARLERSITFTAQDCAVTMTQMANSAISSLQPVVQPVNVTVDLRIQSPASPLIPPLAARNHLTATTSSTPGTHITPYAGFCAFPRQYTKSRGILTLHQIDSFVFSYSNIKPTKPKSRRGSSARSSKDGWNVLKYATTFIAFVKQTRLTLDLSAPATISEGSDASRYARTGNVAGLRRLLVERAVHISASTLDGWSLLHTAAYGGHLALVAFLLQQGVDPTLEENGRRKPGDLARVRALHDGATKDQKEIARIIPGAEFFELDHDMTPVHVAVLQLQDYSHTPRPDLSCLLEFIEGIENGLTSSNRKTFEAAKRKTSRMYEEVFQLHTQKIGSTDTARKQTRIIDVPDTIHGWTPLMWATITARRQAMEALVDSEANPFSISKKGRNIIHLAAESGCPKTMAYVLNVERSDDQQNDINLGDAWLETPLHIASTKSGKCVRLLLEKGADRALRQENDQCPLHYAGMVSDQVERRNIVDILSEDLGPHINFPDMDGRTPIFEAIDNAECLQILMDRGANLEQKDNTGRSLIHCAAMNDYEVALQTLLERCPAGFATEYDGEGNTPIALAFQCGSPKCAKALFEMNAVGDFDGKDGWYLVHHASKMGNPEVLEAVLKHPDFCPGKRTSTGESAADIAKAEGKFEGKVRELLKEYDSLGRRARSTEE